MAAQMGSDPAGVSSAWRQWNGFQPAPSPPSASPASAKQIKKSTTRRTLLSTPDEVDSLDLPLSQMPKYTTPPLVTKWLSNGVKLQSIQPPLYYCTWAGRHQSLDLMGFANTSRNRNLFRISGVKLDEKSGEYKLEQISSFRTSTPAKAAAWGGDYVAVPTRDGSISLYKVLKESGKIIEEPVIASTLTFGKATFSGVANTRLQALQPGEERDITVQLPKHILSLDIGCPNPALFEAAASIPQKVVAQRQHYHVVWDINRPNEPIHLTQSKIPSRTVRWCHMWPAYNNFARGSVSGSIKVYDLRIPDQEAVVWKATHAHAGGIRDLQWSPFIPYWFATAGEDARIKVWDLRYQKSSLIELNDHSSAVNSIAWSPAHADVIASGSSDRSVRLWNLRVLPHYTIGTCMAQQVAVPDTPYIDSSVVSVAWTNTRPNPALIAVGSSGQMTAMTPSASLFASIVPSRSDALPKVAMRTIEKQVVARQFDSAFKSALQLGLQLKQEGRVAEAIKVLAICYQRGGFDLPNWIPNSQLDGPEIPVLEKFSKDTSKFKDDLEFFSYYIPPNYPDHLWPFVDPSIMFDIEMLKTNLELEQAVRNNDAAEILRSADDIADFLRRSISSVDAVLLYKALALLTGYDLIGALHLGSQIASIYADWQKGNRGDHPFQRSQAAVMAAPSTLTDTEGVGAQHFLNIVNLLLYPTVYEEDDVKKKKRADESPDSLNTAGRSFKLTTNKLNPFGLSLDSGSLGSDTKITAEKLSKQLAFLRDFYRLLWGPQHYSAALTLFENFERDESQVLSADANRIYLNAQLTSKDYDKYFVKALALSEQTKNSSFGPLISNQIATMAPRFLKHIRDTKSSLRKSASSELLGSPEYLQAAKDPDYVKYAKAAIQVAVILHRADMRSAPKNLATALPTSLNQLINDLDSALLNTTGVSPLTEMNMGEDDTPSTEVIPTAARAAIKAIEELVPRLREATNKPAASPLSPRSAPPDPNVLTPADLVTKLSTVLDTFIKKTKRRLVARSTTTSTSSTLNPKSAARESRRSIRKTNDDSTESSVDSESSSSSFQKTPSSRRLRDKTDADGISGSSSSKSRRSADDDDSAAESESESGSSKKLSRLSSRRAAMAEDKGK